MEDIFYRDSLPDQIYLCIIDEDSQIELGPVFIVNSSYHCFNFELVEDDSGNLNIVWLEKTGNWENQKYYLHYMKLKRNGAVLVDELRVLDQPIGFAWYGSDPFLARLLPDGNIMIIFTKMEDLEILIIDTNGTLVQKLDHIVSSDLTGGISSITVDLENRVHLMYGASVGHGDKENPMMDYTSFELVIEDGEYVVNELKGHSFRSPFREGVRLIQMDDMYYLLSYDDGGVEVRLVQFDIKSGEIGKTLKRENGLFVNSPYSSERICYIYKQYYSSERTSRDWELSVYTDRFDPAVMNASFLTVSGPGDLESCPNAWNSYNIMDKEGNIHLLFFMICGCLPGNFVFYMKLDDEYGSDGAVELFPGMTVE
jgi:hypothetical protein